MRPLGTPWADGALCPRAAVLHEYTKRLCVPALASPPTILARDQCYLLSNRCGAASLSPPILIGGPRRNTEGDAGQMFLSRSGLFL